MVSKAAVLCSVLVVLSRLESTWCVSAANFLPYGTEHGDAIVELGTDSTVAAVSLPEAFTFLGETFSTVQVNINGALELGPVSRVPQEDAKLIAPYFGTVDATSSGGNVSYRSTNDSDLVQRVSNIVTANFDLSEGLTLQALFIATWYHIPAAGGVVEKHNTFQCVLAYSALSVTAGSGSESPEPRVLDPMSFVLFLYEDGGIQWSRGEGDSAQHALVGFSNGDDKQLILPTSRTDAVLSVATTGNTGVAGQWLFRVDGAQVLLPAPLVGLEHAEYPSVSESAGTLSVCVKIHAGEPSRDFSVTLLVNGQELSDLSFQTTGLTKQCTDVSIVDDGVVEYNETLTLELTSSDEGYLTLLPSTAVINIADDDIAVGWESPEYSVTEGSGPAQPCVTVQAAQLSRNVVVTITTASDEGTAGTSDYTPVSTELTFQPNDSSTLCVNVPIANDAIVENDETLRLSLEISDNTITVTSTETTVTIQDDNDVLRVRPIFPDTNVQETHGNLDLCLLILGQRERNFDIGLKLVDGSAQAGAHYVNSSGVTSIAPVGRPCFTVPIINNNIYDVEGADFTGTLYTSDPSVRITDDTFRIHVRDNDASKVLISFSQQSFRGSENDDSVAVCARLIRGQIGMGSHLDVRLTTDTLAIPPDRHIARVHIDYEEAELVMRFDSVTHGPLCLDVPIIDDDIFEDSETFLMEIKKEDRDQGFLVSPATGRVAIDDNDSVTARVENTEVIVDEDFGARARICVVVDGDREVNLDMRATPSPENATVGADYINTAKDFTLPTTRARACTHISILNDFQLETLYETFFVDVTAVRPRVHFNESRVKVIIRDSDILCVTHLEAPQLSVVNENNSFIGTFCAITIGLLDIDISLSLQTEDNTAIAGLDYVPFNRTKVIRPGDINQEELTGRVCTGFSAVDDIIVEGTESFFVVVTPISARVKPCHGGSDRIKITIVDDDVVRVSPAINSVSVSEGEGYATVCATMIGLTERPIDIIMTTNDITAIEGVDYTLENNKIHFSSYLDVYGTLDAAQIAEFTANPPRRVECGNITIVDDGVLENITSKEFEVHFSSQSLPSNVLKIQSGVTVTIHDDDNVILALNESMVVVGEGDQRVRIPLSLIGEADYPITATIRTQHGGGTAAATADEDYDDLVDSVTIPAHYIGGDLLTNELTVPIRDDNLLEDAESFDVVLESRDPRVLLGVPHIQTIWIEDNDYMEVELDSAEFRVLESAEYVSVCCERRGATGKYVTVNITSSPGTATAGKDYEAPPSQFVFPPSPDIHQTQCLRFSLLNDEVLEAVESFFVTISTSVPRVTVGRDTSTVSLVDDDGVFVTLVNSSLSVEEDGEEGEGGVVKMCVRMTGIIEREVEIDLFTEADTAHANTDFTAASEVITFQPSDLGNQTKCKNFTYLNDNIVEDTERFYIRLETSGPGHDNVDIVINRARILILDTDSVSVDLERFTYSATEGEDEEVHVCVVLGAQIEKRVTVQFTAVADTAQHYSDFLQTESQLVFEPRNTTRDCTPITVMDDMLLEDEEYFVVYILISDPALFIASDPESTNSSATVALGDNDHVNVALETSVYTVDENVTSVAVCSILSGAIGKSVPISFSSRPGTAQAELDYSAHQSEFSFLPSDEPQQTVCVDVLVVDDDILEDVETFYVDITTTVPRVAVLMSTATMSVVDDDSVVVTLVRSRLSVEEEMEGGEVEVCVHEIGVIEKEVEVQVFTEEDTAHGDADFTNDRHFIQFSPSLANNQTACVSFYVINDVIVEGDENFRVLLTASDSFVRINISEMTVSISDSDNVSVNFDHSVYSVNEEEEEMTVCVELGAEVEREVSVRLTTSDATAYSSSDFTQVDTELSFQPQNATRLCMGIPIENDDILEDEEYFLLSMLTADKALYTGNDEAAGKNSTVVVTVTDNDSVSVGLVVSEHSVEEEGGEVEVCVLLMGLIERDVMVTLFTEPGTAYAGVDYNTATHSVLFHPLRSDAQINCTAFSIIDDETVEDTESFVVRLTAGDSQIIPVNDRAIISITDVDVVSVELKHLAFSVSESDSEVTVCVQLGAEVEKRVSVRMLTDEGTAQQSVDFTKIDTEIYFEPRAGTVQCIGVPIIDNNVLEMEEQFFVYIFGADHSIVVDGEDYVEIEAGSGGGDEEVLVGGVRGEVVIADDDSVRIGVEQREDYVVEESDGEVMVCLVLEGEMERTVDITVQTLAGTARAGVDFFTESRTVTYGPQSEREGECVRVQLINDEVVEEDERFTVRISSGLEGSAVVLDPKVASILIIDEDVECEDDRTTSIRGDYFWELTRPGVIELPCQYGEEGVARRLCNEEGVWEEVDLEECYAPTKDLFPYIDKMPFNCESFHELLEAVIQATEESDFKPVYVAIVARFFNSFADITKRDGYIVEDHECLGEEDTFTTGVKILNQLFKWPREILWNNSTSIIRNFEAVSEQLVANPESAYMTIPLENIAFSSFLDEKSVLENAGVMRQFSTNRNALKVADEPSDSTSNTVILGTIHLPSSLFVNLEDKELTEVGVWFSLHTKGSFFRLPDSASVNDSVSTPVISATVGGHRVENLEDPITFSLRVLNQSVTDIKCASWDHEKEEWTTAGCETVPVKDGYVTCSCTHLTNFAGLGEALVQNGGIRREAPSLALSVISLVGAMLALVALTLTLFSLLAFGKLRRRRTTILRTQLSVSLLLLLLAYVGHIVIDYMDTLPQDISIPCTVVSVFTHYFTLTSLVWLGAEAVLMLRKLAYGQRLGNPANLYFAVVSITSWVVPFPFAAIPAVLNQDWMVTENEYCFISSFPVFLATFAAPAGVILLFNVIVYLIVLCMFIKYKCKKELPLTDSMESSPTKWSKSRRQATVRLLFSSPAMTTFLVLTWVCAGLIFMTSEASLAFHLLSMLFSILLGWFIFIYYIATAKDTKKLVHDALCGKKQPSPKTHQFLSMESLGKASEIDESDSDSDYPERERRYGEFDVTYIGQKREGLIEQKFSIRFMGEGGQGAEGGEGADGIDEGGENDDSGKTPLEEATVAEFSASNLTSLTDEKPMSSSEASLLQTSADTPRTIHVESTSTQKDPEQAQVHSGKESPLQMSSEEDVDSDECHLGTNTTSDKDSASASPPELVVFTATTEL